MTTINGREPGDPPTDEALGDPVNPAEPAKEDPVLLEVEEEDDDLEDDEDDESSDDDDGEDE